MMSHPATVAVDWNAAQPTPDGGLVHHSILAHASRNVVVGEAVIIYEGDYLASFAVVTAITDKGLITLLEEN